MLGIRTSARRSVDQPRRDRSRRGRGPPRPQPRRIGRVMQVGPPEPLIPISVAGIGVDLAAGRGERGGGPRVALGHDDHARAGRPARCSPSVGNSSSGTSTRRMPSSPSSCPQPDRQQRQVDDREVVGDRRDDATSGGSARPGRASTGRRRSGRRRRRCRRAGARPRRWSAASARCRTGPAGARACRRPRPCRAPRSGPTRRDAGGRRPRLDGRRLAGAVRLPRPERDRRRGR